MKAGDYIVRGDQPYRTLADMYFSIQNYSPANPRPYDDTGWTFQYMRNVTILPVGEKSILDQAMTAVTAKVHAAGGIEGTGPVLIVDHTTDNNLMKFRFTHAAVRDAGGGSRVRRRRVARSARARSSCRRPIAPSSSPR